MVGAREPDSSSEGRSQAPLDKPPGHDDVVGWTVVRLAHVLARQFEQGLRTVDLTPTQFGVLATIASEPGIGSGQLARQTLVTPQSVGEVVASLEAAGHIARDRSGGRGRKAGINLTPQGQELLGAAYRIVAAQNDPAALGLVPDEAATLNALLHRMLRTIQTSR